MIVATAAASIGIFLVALLLLRVVPAASNALTIARGAFEALRDPGLDDAARERAARSASIRLFGSFISILARGALAVAASLLPIWLADALGLARYDQIFDFLARWDVILIASIVLVLGYVVRTLLWSRN